eukprot:TRINITY_DN18974_c0_g1_i1.p2 TRINITY_DN18974_c0_g1~~TRINITY_DN18974_c0_g1_i1.p2  ORF type:complete len:267 (-),score=68.05 TRINITY_DN18974_c0_g1_i1:80-880(-)
MYQLLDLFMSVSFPSLPYCHVSIMPFFFFFFKDTAPTEIYTRSIVGSVRCVQETVSTQSTWEVDLDNQLLSPSWSHWFGTDMFGRDLLTRVIYGARISLVIGLVPSFFSMFIGTVLGILAGYYGGWTDFWIMRLADMVLAFPSLLLAMCFMYTLGATLFNIFIALSLVGWATTARVVRSQTLSLKEKEFVEAARAMGVRRRTIMIRHIFPNCLPALVVLFTLRIPQAIMSEASLSFLGVGAQSPTCLLYTSPSPRDLSTSRMPSSA